MRIERVLPLIAAALLLAGCTGIGLPQRGFATRFFQSDIEPDLRPPPAAFEGTPLLVNGMPAAPNACEAIAQARAHDAAVQGFGDAVQQQVFTGTLADCRRWRDRSH